MTQTLAAIRKATLLLVALSAVGTVGNTFSVLWSQEPKTQSEPASELKAAEAIYQDVYGSEHKKATASRKATDKLAFARTLVADSKKPAVQANPTLVRVLLGKALSFCGSDKDGARLIVDIRKLELEFASDRLVALPEVVNALEQSLRHERFGSQERLDCVKEMLAVLREIATLQEVSGDLNAALATLGRAKTLARGASPNEFKEIEASDKALRSRMEQEKKLAAVRAVLAKVPQDPVANQELGLLLLADGDSVLAASHLALSTTPTLVELGRLLTNSSDDAAVGDAAREAAGTKGLPESARTVLYELARSRYNAYLEKNRDTPESAAVTLKLGKLPAPATGSSPGAKPFTGAVLFDDEKAFVEAMVKGGGSATQLDESQHNSGKASIAFRGGAAVPQMTNWKYQIVEKPSPGQYRFLRFAYRCEPGTTAVIAFADNGNFTIKPGRPGFRYSTSRIANAPWPYISLPPERTNTWVVVTCDLYKDFGAFTITGIAFASMTDNKTVWFDGIVLGRTLEELKSFP